MTNNMRFNHCGPQFVVQSVTKSVEFYSDVLGFGVDYLSGSPPDYAVVFRDEVYIHLCHQRVIDYNIGPGASFIAVSGVDRIWQRVQSSGAVVTDPLSDQDYGQGVRFRLFTIKDLDENILRIGEQLR